MYSFQRSGSTAKIDPQYEPFIRHLDVDTLPSIEEYPHEVNRTPKLLASVFGIIAITSTFWIMVIVTINHPFGSKHVPSSWDRHNITSNARLLECGNSTTEAKALGCQYDVLLNSWVPEPCLERDFVDEYLDDDSWTAYRDEALTQPIPTIEEMSEIELYYTSLRDHMNHCAMMWKRQFWVLYKEKPAIDTMSASPRHTDHCALFLADSRDVNLTQSTKVDRSFAGCWIRDV
ncbi:unnamed protein product [Blumeria hordei]|uniref:Uncharacterized protein n=2 Tax=Blumeria hordei TaxID=2867405 RepID=A0A383UJP0_BLUHO|nr:hypothetical protein BGHDH14_bgh04296 [Blumeria hordei DH14]SZE99457.1 unnamed protein product [Blumeria hordei]